MTNTISSQPSRSHSNKVKKGRHWRRFVIFLLTLEVLYVLWEFGFNAAILNMSSGSLPHLGEWSARNLESVGYSLSGIGLGLLIYGIVLLRRDTPPTKKRCLGMALLIFPLSMFGMTQFNQWLIYYQIPSRSTATEFAAAQYLRMLPSAVQSGLIDIEGTPLTRESLNRPESKAFLTLLTPALLSDRQVVSKIVNAAPDIIKYQVHQKAMDAGKAAYKVYSEINRKMDIDTLYRAYAEASRQYQTETTKLIRERTNGTGYHWTARGIAGGLNKYMEYSRKGQAVPLSNHPSEIGLSAREFLAHPDSPHMRRLDWELRHSERVKPHHFKITGYNQRTGKYTVGARDFIRLVTTEEARETFNDNWRSKAANDYGVSSRGGDPVLPGWTKAQLIGSEWLQVEIIVAFDKAGIDWRDQGTVWPGLSESEFISRHMLTKAWAEADTLAANLEPSIRAAVQDPEIRKHLPHIYGPAIALTLSLFFSLLTVGKIAGRVWMLANLESRRPDQWLNRVKLGIFGGTALVILILPMLITTNTLARSDAIEAAAGKGSSGLTLAVMRWTMDVEPLIYPLGNALLPYIPEFPFGWLPIYHDPNAGQSDTNGDATKVREVELIMPLTVRQLQVRLQQAGMNPGPADGVIGQKTVDALKQFQRKHRIEATGTQTPETIRVLRTR